MHALRGHCIHFCLCSKLDNIFFSFHSCALSNCWVTKHFIFALKTLSHTCHVHCILRMSSRCWLDKSKTHTRSSTAWLKQEHRLFFYYWNICQQLLCCVYSSPKGLSHEVIQRHAHTVSHTAGDVSALKTALSFLQPQTSSEVKLIRTDPERMKKSSSGQLGDVSATQTTAVCLIMFSFIKTRPPHISVRDFFPLYSGHYHHIPALQPPNIQMAPIL